MRGISWCYNRRVGRFYPARQFIRQVAAELLQQMTNFRRVAAALLLVRRASQIHSVWFVWDTGEFLIMSHFIHTGRQMEGVLCPIMLI